MLLSKIMILSTSGWLYGLSSEALYPEDLMWLMFLYDLVSA